MARKRTSAGRKKLLDSSSDEESDIDFSSESSDSPRGNQAKKRNQAHQRRQMSSDDDASNTNAVSQQPRKSSARKSTATRQRSQESSDCENLDAPLSRRAKKQAQSRQTSNSSVSNDASNTQPRKSSARKSTATRQRSQESSDNENSGATVKSQRTRSNDSQLNKGSSKATTSGVTRATRRLISASSNSESEKDETSVASSSVSSRNKAKKSTASRPTAPSNKAPPNPKTDSVINQRKRGRPPSAPSINGGGQNSPISTPSTSLNNSALPDVSDETSDEATRPTPNARSNMTALASKPVLKRSGTYSPLKKNTTVLTEASMKQLVNSCVQYLLIVDQKKHAIKKVDIKKNVFKENTRSFNEVIIKVNAILKQVYGLELVELENQKDQYMIINILPDALEFADYTEKEQCERGLISYLLTVIYMNGNTISEDELWASLKTFGIDPDSRKPHSVFGDVKKFITKELVGQMYLDYKKVPNTEPTQHEFLWGLRAKEEVNKWDLLKFACDVYGDCKMEDWILQHQDAALSSNPPSDD